MRSRRVITLFLNNLTQNKAKSRSIFPITGKWKQLVVLVVYPPKNELFGQRRLSR